MFRNGWKAVKATVKTNTNSPNLMFAHYEGTVHEPP